MAVVRDSQAVSGPPPGIGHDHEVPALTITAGRGLDRQVHAFLKQLARYRPGEVKAVTDRPGGGEEFVGREGESHALTFAERAVRRQRRTFTG